MDASVALCWFFGHLTTLLSWTWLWLKVSLWRPWIRTCAPPRNAPASNCSCRPRLPNHSLTDRQLFHLKPIAPCRGALLFVCGNEQFRGPLGGGGKVQGIGGAQRPALEKFDGACHDLVRHADHARVFDVLEERLFGP